MRWHLLRRIARTVLTVYVFLTVTFLAFALTPDPNKLLLLRSLVGANASTINETLAAYDALRGRNRPLFVRWADWMISITTLQWGRSLAFDEPVLSVVARTTPKTLSYLVPGVLLSSVLSVATGVYTALRRGGLLDRLTQGVIYLGIGLPAFFLGVYLGRRHLDAFGFLTAIPTVFEYTVRTTWLPAFIVGLNLFAIQARGVRSEALELAPQEFVKTLRANGASTRRIARHVLRNAAAPVLALFTAEVFVVMFVTTYVLEIVLEIPGLALASFIAFEERDLGLILGSLLVFVLAGLVLDLIQDLLASVIDPRVAGDGRE